MPVVVAPELLKIKTSCRQEQKDHYQHKQEDDGDSDAFQFFTIYRCRRLSDAGIFSPTS